MFNNPTLEELASWPKPSEHPVTRVKELIAAEIALSVLLTIILLLRYASRIFVTKAFAADDWMILPAYIFTLAFNINGTVSGQYGWGWHVWDIPAHDIQTMLKLTYVQIPLFITANTLIKLSIVLFYRRIFCAGGTSKWFKISLRVLFGFIILWWVAYLFLGAFVCTPVRAYWYPLPIKGQVCRDVEGYISYGGIDIATDLILLLLPQWKIWHLQMPLLRKLAVAIVMSFAALAVAAGVMRLPFILKATQKGFDKTWDGMDLTIWSTAELTLGIGCASAPALRAFFTQNSSPAVAGAVRSLNQWVERSIANTANRGGTALQSSSDEADTITAVGSSEMAEAGDVKKVAGIYRVEVGSDVC